MQNLEEIKMANKCNSIFLVLCTFSEIPYVVLASAFQDESIGYSGAAIATRNSTHPKGCSYLRYAGILVCKNLPKTVIANNVYESYFSLVNIF